MVSEPGLVVGAAGGVLGYRAAKVPAVGVAVDLDGCFSVKVDPEDLLGVAFGRFTAYGALNESLCLWESMWGHLVTDI